MTAPEPRCWFCRAKLADVRQLVTAADGLAICDRCVQRAADSKRVARGDDCSFCGQRTWGACYAANRLCICGACVVLCADILRASGTEIRLPLPRATLVRDGKA